MSDKWISMGDKVNVKQKEESPKRLPSNEKDDEPC